MLDFDFHGLAVLQRAQALVVGAAGDEIAGVHGHHRGGELDQLRHAVLHVVGIVVVAQLAVVPEPHDRSLGSAISSAVAMQGPIGAKVSKDLPSQLVSGSPARCGGPCSRAETSIMAV